MATQTPLHHPKLGAQTQQFYPFRLTLNDKVSKTNVAENLPCAYEPAQGGKSETFETEAPAEDRLRVPQWVQAAETNQIAIVSMGAAGVRRFNVLDVQPIGGGPDATMLIVEPRN